MLTIQHGKLRELATEILVSAGAVPDEAVTVSDALVDANLDGHDSHGVLRIPDYVEWMEKGLISKRAEYRVLRETEAFALIDGNWGWGQVVGRRAIEIAIQKAKKIGVGTVAARRCSHLGRAGDYPRIAAEEGLAAIMLVNTHGAGRLVAPWGGRERRLSANPIALSVPRSSGEPIVLDISTCAIAGGKVRVALHKKERLPENCIVDSDGLPTTDPADFYGPPEGALLPFGGHKGFGLALLGDILVGALSGAGCSRPDATRVANGFLVFVVDIRQFCDRQAFNDEVDQLVQYVKSSKLAPGFTEILIPGEPEAKERSQRKQNGIPIAEETWRQICDTGKRYNLNVNDGA